MAIRILVTGGTFDKEYDELTGRLFFKDTHVQEMLDRGRCRVDVAVETVMMIDSLDLDDRGRAGIVHRCREAAEACIVITHGTDTMVETARALAGASLSGKTIVLTGAMVPYAFGSSDGLFNLGSALSFVQVLSPGVYIAMNGRHFPWDRVRKNRAAGVFELDDMGDPSVSGSKDGVTKQPETFAQSTDVPGFPAPPLQSRLPSVGTTIFTVMSKLAADVGAVNLSQGFPDFDCDPALVEAVARHMRAGLNQYAPMQGVPALRQAIAAKYAHYYGTRYDPDTEVTVTSGGTEAIFDAVASVVHRGDQVVVLEPCYDSYVPAIVLNGGVPVAIPLRLPDYRIDWDAVRQAITPRTRLLMINSPHNPTGAILDAGDIAALTEIVDRTGIYVLSDEVYEHIIFDGARHESMARHPALAARSFVVGSFGKTYHVTGWKVGYAVAPAALTAELRKVHQFVTFSTHTPVQHAIAEFLSERTGLDELPTFFERKRDLFLQLMEGSRFKPLPCRGSYFQLMDYSAISDLADGEFAIWLTKEHGVASIPTSSMLQRSTAPRVVRFCFAKMDETLARAAERLRTI